ncbi:hypothetical protein [Solicola sp. PLA-1-18]
MSTYDQDGPIRAKDVLWLVGFAIAYTTAALLLLMAADALGLGG